jgi:hypothetical protein
MAPISKLVVCDRCGLIAVLQETAGWLMYTTQKGLCQVCAKDAEEAAQTNPRSKAATRQVGR